MSKIEYKHRTLREAIFNLCCLAYVGVNDKTLVDNLNKDCEQELNNYDDLKQRYAKLYQALEIIKNKRVDVSLITDTKSLQEYNEKIPQYVICDENGVDRLLSQEEYDLLKEVLL